MNGLTLRINRSENKKAKNSLVFAPVVLSNCLIESLAGRNTLFDSFLNSNADEQLTLLKSYLNDNKQACDRDIIKFLVVVFLQADSKHPVKCFLARHITKNVSLQQPFAEELATEIQSYTLVKHVEYKEYANVVSKISTCIENFPTGASAVKMVDIPLAEYLKHCLECCVRTLRETNTLSPTEKNEIFNLAHLALRLLLYIIQKISSDDVDKIDSMFSAIRLYIKDLLFDDDVPMDTKSVCGILYLTTHILENGVDSWMDMLKSKHSTNELNQLLNNGAAQLSLYSAIPTVVSIDKLQTQTIDNDAAIIALTRKILAVGERSSSESTFTLSVTRTLLQITKMLDKITDNDLGLTLVDCLLVFVWSHLEHYMDSVRHLTAQALNYIVKYCTRLKTGGNDDALNSLFSALISLDKTRKSYYVSLTSLTSELGATGVMEKLPDVMSDVMSALSIQAVQASATTALETLLRKHVLEASTETIYKQWIEHILSYVSTNILDSGVLNVLENLLAKAVKLDEDVMNYILPYIKSSCDINSTHSDLKCILMLLSVARKSGVTSKLSSEENKQEWKGIISYDILKLAAVDSVEETRVLSLSLIVDSPKSTELFAKGELDFVLHYLKYNINAQSPNFRQLTLSMMKKFVKRLEDSYKVLIRKKENKIHEVNYYLKFLEDLRHQLFQCLVPGANYSRRCVALQMLVWCEQLNLVEYERIWKEDYIEKLLQHLEDSYENNKALALDILIRCPVEMLKCKNYSVSLKLNDIVSQASSVKPTDCVSAAYKLSLLKKKLPESVLIENYDSVESEVAWYCVVRRLVRVVREEAREARRSVVAAARRAPMHGLLHALGHVLRQLNALEISEDDNWSTLIEEVISICMEVNSCVACVVNNSSPEGHLPMDMSGVAVTDHGNTGGVCLDDGRQVTAQMVLLCAWRSVKEVSLLLGEISSRLTVRGEGQASGTLSPEQLLRIGEHFTTLLAETKHRGAFEQAYVGFTKLLSRLWRCRNPVLHELPRSWLLELTAAISSNQKGTLCATRRSAGLPFMIQALVTTELQVRGNPRCFHRCMGTLLTLAGARASPGGSDTRTHSLNILRALFRNSALDESVAGYVGDGLLAALAGFEGDTWPERNSSTLLFSALAVRIFGVQRSRDPDNLCTRNRMTGRIFFLRYPQLYDYMLEKLKEVSRSDNSQLLRPSLYPVLLLLARLYPSSLEGTVSNLKLVAYIPHVLACARSSVLKTRQLAAKAMVPLISPEQYISHLEAMLVLLHDQYIKRNYCHGILLQLTRLLDSRPENLVIDRTERERLMEYIEGTHWILEQALGDVPCYVLADEYVKVVNLVIWRFPSLFNEGIGNKIRSYLYQLIFNCKQYAIHSGRDICLANSLYLYLILLNKYNKDDIPDIISKSLSHESYEVVLSALNYLLILHKKIDSDSCKFQQHIAVTSNENIIKHLRENSNYITVLCDVLRHNKYLECTQKTLKVLTLEEDTQKHIVGINAKEVTEEMVTQKLFDCIENEHESVTHIYLESLSKFVSRKLRESKLSCSTLLGVVRVMFACSSSDNSNETRAVVVGFLERNCEVFLRLILVDLRPEERLEFKATLWATIVTLLEDDDEDLRQRTSNIVAKLCLGNKCTNSVMPSKSAELMRDYLETQHEDNVAIFVVLALLDFKSEVCITDEVSDECRVFDQNERYNIFLEETVWTGACADKIIRLCNKQNVRAVDMVRHLVDDAVLKETFDKLCKNNVTVFKKILEGDNFKNDVINPKIGLFVSRLCN